MKSENMKTRFSSSVHKLILLGFFVVVIPLLLALISTVYKVDGMAVQMQKTVRNSARAVETSRLITTQALSLGRSAEQYGVLRDPALLDRYEQQREQLIAATGRLTTLPIEIQLQAQLEQLSHTEETLWQQLRTWSAQPDTESRQLAPELSLADLVKPIPKAVTEWIIRDSEAMIQRVEHLQHLLLWQAVALIPLALVLAAVFSVLITRPLHRLGKEIHRLGGGQLNTSVAVSGPQDIQELGRKLEWMRQSLAEIDQQKQYFLQHVSHELKTPLTAIREGTELLRDGVVGKLEDEQRRVVRIMHESALMLQGQVEALLNFNQAMALDSLVQVEPVDFTDIVIEVAATHQLAMQPRGIKLLKELDAVVITGEGEQLRTVVDNLLSNAIKYSPDNGKIILRLQRETEAVALDVIDQGPGVAADYRQQIFQPFVQGQHVAKSPLKGTGLGLAIVQRYVDLHSGRIVLMDSTEGAHFRVTLPMRLREVDK